MDRSNLMEGLLTAAGATVKVSEITIDTLRPRNITVTETTCPAADYAVETNMEYAMGDMTVTEEWVYGLGPMVTQIVRRYRKEHRISIRSYQFLVDVNDRTYRRSKVYKIVEALAQMDRERAAAMKAAILPSMLTIKGHMDIYCAGEADLPMERSKWHDISIEEYVDIIMTHPTTRDGFGIYSVSWTYGTIRADDELNKYALPVAVSVHECKDALIHIGEKAVIGRDLELFRDYEYTITENPAWLQYLEKSEEEAMKAEMAASEEGRKDNEW